MWYYNWLKLVFFSPMDETSEAVGPFDTEDAAWSAYMDEFHPGWRDRVQWHDDTPARSGEYLADRDIDF